MGKNIRSTRCLFMGKHIRSNRCLFMGKIICSNISFVYVKGHRLFAHKLPIILPPTGTYYLTYTIKFRQLVYGCLGYFSRCISFIYTYSHPHIHFYCYASK